MLTIEITAYFYIYTPHREYGMISSEAINFHLKDNPNLPIIRSIGAIYSSNILNFLLNFKCRMYSGNAQHKIFRLIQFSEK